MEGRDSNSSKLLLKSTTVSGLCEWWFVKNAFWPASFRWLWRKEDGYRRSLPLTITSLSSAIRCIHVIFAMWLGKLPDTSAPIVNRSMTRHRKHMDAFFDLSTDSEAAIASLSLSYLPSQKHSWYYWRCTPTTLTRATNSELCSVYYH